MRSGTRQSATVSSIRKVAGSANLACTRQLSIRVAFRWGRGKVGVLRPRNPPEGVLTGKESQWRACGSPSAGSHGCAKSRHVAWCEWSRRTHGAMWEGAAGPFTPWRLAVGHGERSEGCWRHLGGFLMLPEALVGAEKLWRVRTAPAVATRPARVSLALPGLAGLVFA